jgi:hypothetical protein
VWVSILANNLEFRLARKRTVAKDRPLIPEGRK